MSLTSELKKKDSVSSEFVAPFLPRLRELSARVNSSIRDATVLPPGFTPRYPFMLVGTAVDYRLRFYFGVDSLRNMIIVRGLWSLPRGFEDFFDSFDEFLDTVAPVRNVLSDADEERLCRYCLILACVDHIERGGSDGAMQFMQSIKRYGVKRKLATVDDRMVADLSEISRAFAKTNGDLIRTFSVALVGETCAGSVDVLGADFDLLIDGCLFD